MLSDVLFSLFLLSFHCFDFSLIYHLRIEESQQRLSLLQQKMYKCMTKVISLFHLNVYIMRI